MRRVCALSQLERLDRLTLCVSADCSLACGYCYAQRGTYGAKRPQGMDASTALHALLWAFDSFGSVRHIQFFGGEPTLEPRIIDMACEFARNLSARRGLDGAPSFGLTTNGLHLEGDVLKTIDRHRIATTVSIDGPPEIHDRLRRQRSGEASFESIAAGVARLQAIGIEPEIECTYTRAHVRAGFSVLDLLDFFGRRFHSRIVHCPTVVAAPGSPWYVDLREVVQTYAEAVRASASRALKGECVLSMAARWIRSLDEARPTEHYCPAGSSALTVATDGTVYPCFMFIGRPDASVGSIQRRGLRDSAGVRELLEAGCTATDPRCRECWIGPVCFGCLGDDLARGGGSVVRSALPGHSAGCDFRRALAEALLEGVRELKRQG